MPFVRSVKSVQSVFFHLHRLSAAIRTLPPIPAPSLLHRPEEAETRNRIAERPVNKDLKFHVAAAFGDGGNLLERQLSRQDNTLEPEVLHRQHTLEVVRDKLRRGMELQIGEMLPANPRDADVLHDQRIGLHLVQSRYLLNRILEIILVNDRVKGDVNLLAFPVSCSPFPVPCSLRKAK